MLKNKKVGLSLSGGGYRAAAFHLGTLRKLNELKILDKVDTFSTISGGSIAGVYYLLHKDDFSNFEATLSRQLSKSVIRRIVWSPWLYPLYLFLLSWFIIAPYYLSFLATVVGILSTLLILLFFQFPLLPFTKLKVKAYKKLFFEDKQIKDLPDTPEIAINATNLETSTLWTFSKRKVGDSSYEFRKDQSEKISFKALEFPLALAVASSTSVPAFFGPVRIPKKYFSNPDDALRVKPRLSDGGLYDNQGIHKLTQENSSYACDIIICSDGSEPFSYRFKGFNAVITLYRATDIMMRRIKSMQFIRDVYSKKFEIAYYSLDWQYELCVSGFVNAIKKEQVSQELLDYHNLTKSHIDNLPKTKDLLIAEVKAKINFSSIVSKGLPPEEIKYISGIKTGLSAFSERKINLLSRHAACLTELQIKLYCPSLI